MKILCSLFLLMLFVAPTQTPRDSALTQDLDAFIARALATDATPGMAVAVVRGTDIIYAKGVGFADKEASRHVIADTQFYIASTTKSFTGLAASLLATRLSGPRQDSTAANSHCATGLSSTPSQVAWIGPAASSWHETPNYFPIRLTGPTRDESE